MVAHPSLHMHAAAISPPTNNLIFPSTFDSSRQFMMRKLPLNLANKKISRQNLIEAFNRRVRGMEAAKDGLTSASSANSRRTNLQSMDDFMREQDELKTMRAAKADNQLLAATSAKKQKKASLQAERVPLEADRIAQKAALQAERERREAERVSKKAALQAEWEQLEADRKEKKSLIQAERELLEAERELKKTTLEVEKLTIEQRAFKAVEELGATNWVGQLLEYRNKHRVATGGLTYNEELAPAIGPPRFTCKVVISESSQHFGSGILFSNKKDAKRYAAKKAVDWLIENSYMPADGPVSFPKPPPPPVVTDMGPVQPVTPATPSPAGSTKSAPKTSYAGKVPELCYRLGFNVPTYNITRHSEDIPLWNGYAHFGGDPRIEGKVGEVKSVYGKSNAKEQIAMEVLSFLKDIERQRMEMEDEEEEGRKRKRKSVSSDIGESAGKTVKIEA